MFNHAFFKDNVVGRHIAMHHASAMGFLQPRGDAAQHHLDLVQRHRAMFNALGQRRARDKLHHQTGPPDHRIIGKHMIAHDGFVAEPRQRRAFLLEQGHDLRIMRQAGQHDLDGDRFAIMDVVAAIDLTHATSADQLVDLIGANDPGAA